MKHKHYEMIVAFAGNTELSVFCKGGLVREWVELPSGGMPCFVTESEYFLCLPQHKEACLHWLNGGELYIDNGKGFGEGSYTLSIKTHNPLSDFIGHQEYKFRIKPKKEKRWIAVNGDKIFFANADEIYPESYQLMQIEVEV